MASIPTSSERNSQQEIGADGYPEGFLDSVDKTYSASFNLDTEVKSQTQQSMDTLKYAIPRVALGAFTELVAAMPGISDEDAVATAKTFTPQSVFADFLKNKEGSQTAGALALSIIPIAGTAKLMRSEKLFNAVTKLGGARAAGILLPSRISMTDKLAGIKKAALVRAGKQQVSMTAETSPLLNAMSKKVIGSAMLDNLKIGLATNAGIYVVANENNFMFPEEMSSTELAAFYAVPDLIVSGVVGLATRYSIKNILRDSGFAAEKARNNFGLPLSELMATPNSRFNVVNTLQLQRNNKTAQLVESTGDSTLEKNVNSQIVELDVQIQQQVNLMGKDSPITGVTKSWELDPASMNTIRAGLDSEGQLLNQVISIENYSARSPQVLLKDMEVARAKQGALIEDQLKVVLKLPQGSAPRFKQQQILDKLFAEKNSLDLATSVKINIDGSMQLVANAKPTYDDIVTGITKQNSSGAKIQSTVNKLKEGDILKTVDKPTNTVSYSVKIVENGKTTMATATDNLKLILAETNKTNMVDGVFTASTYKDFSFKSKTGIQVAMRKAVSEVTPENTLLNPLKPSSDMSHVELDGILEVTDKFGVDSPAVLNMVRFEDEVRGSRPMPQQDKMPIPNLMDMKRDPEYWARAKNKKYQEVPMSPDTYLDYVSKGFGVSKQSTEDAVVKKLVDEYAAAMLRGDKFPKLILDYSDGFSQEGRHRAFAAKQAGFDEVPVIEINKATQAFKIEGTVNTIKNVDDLEFASLSSKYQDFVAEMDIMGKQNLGLIKVSEFDKTKVEDIIRTLNLPNDGTTGLHPVAELFLDTYLNRAVKLSDKFRDLKDFTTAVRYNAKPVSDINMMIKPEKLKMRGEAYTTYDNARKPVYAVLKAGYENPLNREDLIQAVLADRMRVVDGLKNGKNEGADMVSAITEAAMRDPDRLMVAKGVPALMDGSMRSKDRFFQTTFSFENQPALVAADSIGAEMQEITKSYALNKLKQYEPVFQKLYSREGKADLLSFNIFVHQDGNGWRSTKKLVPVESEGKLVGYKVPLEDHEINKSLFKNQFKTETVPDNLFMPQPVTTANGAYKPLVITPAAAEGIDAVNALSQGTRTEQNVLNKVLGRTPIPKKEVHIPAKNLVGKELVYLMNKDTGGFSHVIAGNTPVQANVKAVEEIALAKKQGVNLFSATERTVENFKMLKLEAFEKMKDFSSPLNQTGAAKGTSFGRDIEIGPAVLDRIQESIINQYMTIGRVTASTVFAPEMKAAQFAAVTSGASQTTLRKGEDIWQVWQNRIEGKRSGNKNQVIGKLQGSVEDLYDGLMQKLWDNKVGYFKGAQTEGQAAANFEALDNALPEYNPFTDSINFLENTMMIKTPSNMRRNMSQLNKIMGLTMLRMFNTGLALVNLGTLPTLIPPVAKAMQQSFKDLPLAEAKALNGAWSSPIGEDIMIWNPTRTFTSGMHYVFTDEWRKIAPRAAAKGHLWQKAVEEMQLYTAPRQGYVENMLNKAAEFVSKPVDTTETLSRTIAYASFYNMGKRNLKLGDEAAMDFAHFQANKTIGDFRPNVKPQMFQGAAGAPFSLFTTFAINYMQRVFGYLEKGQMKAFMNQMGLQTAFFGTKSLPGFNEYVNVFTDNYDGSENMVDRLQGSFGTGVTDAILNGSVGTLTNLAVSTKTGVPIPFSSLKQQGNPILNMIPAVSMMDQTFSGIVDTVKSISTNEGFNGRQLSEIASRAFPIRNLQGIFTLANGVEVDRRGQVIDAEMSNFKDIFSRVTNIRTIRSQKVMEEFSRQRSTDMRQKELRQNVRSALRSAFRAGSLNADLLETLIKKSLEAGMEPASIKPMFRNQAMVGLVDKSFARALELANKEAKQRDYMRMLDIISEE